MTVIRRAVFAAVVSLGLSSAGDGDEVPAPKNTQEITTPLLTPQEALAQMKVPVGFRVELFAHEPDVQQPISITTDERGRLWVAECYTYAESKVNFDATQKDRIVVLEDSDGDGRSDKRTVFASGLDKLTSVEVGFGGVWAWPLPICCSSRTRTATISRMDRRWWYSTVGTGMRCGTISSTD